MEELKATARLLCGPGPCNVSPRVLAAMGLPLLGHMDPAFLHVMDKVQEGLRVLFGTSNLFTLPISGWLERKKLLNLKFPHIHTHPLHLSFLLALYLICVIGIIYVHSFLSFIYIHTYIY